MIYSESEMKAAVLCSAISRLSGERIIVSVDGPCASGKSTISRIAAERLGAALIRMDDFFLPQDMRTPERLAEPGGNIHYERFADEVIGGLLSGGAFSYGVFDCSCGRVTRREVVTPERVTIIEGAYSNHPRFGDIYSLRVFVEADEKERLRRIAERDGSYRLEMFVNRWIPLEQRYFEAFDIVKGCDLIL